jgi:hypothetical protein
MKSWSAILLCWYVQTNINLSLFSEKYNITNSCRVTLWLFVI